MDKIGLKSNTGITTKTVLWRFQAYAEYYIIGSTDIASRKWIFS